jgi:hypothetical protein
VADPADVERQMRPEPPQNLTMRSGAATGADSSSSPTDMDSAPPYNMKHMEIPHSKRREWRCEGFEYHSRPLNLVSRYGVKPGLTSRQLLGLRSGLTILPNASAWSARAHASLLFCSVVEEPFASVNRVDWNRPQPGAPSASPTADPVPSRMAAEKALARAFASSSDARRCAVGLPTPCMGAYSNFRGRHIPRKPAQKVSRFDLGPAEANRVLLACRSDLHV